MPTTYTVSINAAGRLNINGTAVGQSFKTGVDGSTGITFDANFWKKCFIGDSNKDGCPLAILDGFLQADYIGGDNRYSGELIKSLSSQMTSKLETDNLIFKAEILRLKNYKTANNPELRTRFSTAFPEGVPIYTNKDCGLDPAVFLPNGRCVKSCNIASNVIDPHSSSTADCTKMLPVNGDTLVLDESVFRYLQYPCACSLSATTIDDGKFNPMSFIVDGEDLLQNATNKAKFFAGNATKNDNFSRNSKPDAKRLNQKLCVAKYSGDTLQSLIQKIFEIINKYENPPPPPPAQAPPLPTFVVSTCDSIVALRSYALNGSYIEVCDDNAQDKVTQVYVWRPNLANRDGLMQICNAEKARILHGYTDFIAVVRMIKRENTENNFNNICLPGTNTTYRFTNGFYDNIITDVQMIHDQINALTIAEAATIADIAGRIRLLRSVQVDDFFKINGRDGQYYMMSMSTKYIKGKYIDLFNPVPVWTIDKRTSQTFFEKASTVYRHVAGGSSMRGGVAKPLYYTEIEGILEKLFSEKKIKNGLHKQFLEDFRREFYGIYTEETHYINYLFGDEYNNISNNYINCLFYVIESFFVLEESNPTFHFYSNKGICWLVGNFFKENLSDIITDLTERLSSETNAITRNKITALIQSYTISNTNIAEVTTERIDAWSAYETKYIISKAQKETEKETQTQEQINNLDQAAKDELWIMEENARNEKASRRAILETKYKRSPSVGSRHKGEGHRRSPPVGSRYNGEVERGRTAIKRYGNNVSNNRRGRDRSRSLSRGGSKTRKNKK